MARYVSKLNCLACVITRLHGLLAASNFIRTPANSAKVVLFLVVSFDRPFPPTWTIPASSSSSPCPFVCRDGP